MTHDRCHLVFERNERQTGGQADDRTGEIDVERVDIFRREEVYVGTQEVRWNSGSALFVTKAPQQIVIAEVREGNIPVVRTYFIKKTALKKRASSV